MNASERYERGTSMTPIIVHPDENQRAALAAARMDRRQEWRDVAKLGSITASLIAVAVIAYLVHDSRNHGLAAICVMVMACSIIASLIMLSWTLDRSERVDNMEKRTRWISVDTPPVSWGGDAFADTGRFLEALVKLPETGLAEYDRSRLQHLASCYARDLRIILDTDTPWRKAEKANVSMEMESTHLDDQKDDLDKITGDIRKTLVRGVEWSDSRSWIAGRMLSSYGQVTNMAQTFGIDMSQSLRPVPVPLPGQVGGIAVEAPIPPQLETLAQQYRSTDRRMLSDMDRAEGDAVVDRDIPLLTEAWRKARITSDADGHEQIDLEYAESARTMCATLSDIMVHVAQDARATLRDTGRYIASKHAITDPLSLESIDGRNQ